MKISKAIELLQRDLDNPGSVPYEDRAEAQELGIEALKRLKEHREEHIDITYRALPGETPEGEK